MATTSSIFILIIHFVPFSIAQDANTLKWIQRNQRVWIEQKCYWNSYCEQHTEQTHHSLLSWIVTVLYRHHKHAYEHTLIYKWNTLARSTTIWYSLLRVFSWLKWVTLACFCELCSIRFFFSVYIWFVYMFDEFSSHFTANLLISMLTSKNCSNIEYI